MKKLLNISVIAALAVLPLAANAAKGDIISVDDPVTAASASQAANAVTSQTAPKYALAVEGDNDGNVATAGYVKGAYNAAIKAINKVSETANSAVQSVEAGTANGTISVNEGADITVYDDSALAGRVTANENKIGNTTLTTTAQTLTGAIEEVKGAAGFAGTASELTDGNFDTADKTSAAKAANAAMAAAAAAQADADAAQADADAANEAIGTIGDLDTTATDLVEAINEVKATADSAVTDADIADFATQEGVELTAAAAVNGATIDFSGIQATTGNVGGTATASFNVMDTWGSDNPSATPITASVNLSNTTVVTGLTGNVANVANKISAGTVEYTEE